MTKRFINESASEYLCATLHDMSCNEVVFCVTGHNTRHEPNGEKNLNCSISL